VLPPSHSSRARSASTPAGDSVIDLIPVATCICNAAIEIERFNQRLVELFGRPVSAGMPLARLLENARTPNGDTLALASMGRNTLGGIPVDCEELVVDHPDGSERTVLVSVAPVRDESGELDGVVASFHDITERTRADAAYAGRRRADRLQELTAALSMASTLTEVAHAAVEHATAAFDADGAVIARLSPDRRELFVMDAVQMPEHVFDAWRSIPVDAHAPLSEVTRTGDAIFLESREDWAAHYPDLLPLLDETGHQANIVVPLSVEGTTIGALGVAFTTPRFFDESDRTLVTAIAQQAAIALERARLYETAEHARTRADEANQSKTQFLTTISHELRTPLNAIAGYADLLALSVYGPVNEAQIEALERIKRSQRHLLSLINDMLNFAKIDGGHVHIEITDVRVSKVCQDVEALLDPQLRAKGLKHENRCDSSLVVRADEEKLRQIMINLVGNSVKFTPPGGTITVLGRAQNDRVLIEVHDTGMGIPIEKLERIFEPFVQLDRSLTSGQEGAGLGLAISRDLARLMGGELSVESAVGKGSVFTVSLPRVV
jgi:PAS domain S-box-containing protein